MGRPVRMALRRARREVRVEAMRGAVEIGLLALLIVVVLASMGMQIARAFGLI